MRRAVSITGGVALIGVLIVRCMWVGLAVLASYKWNIEILMYLLAFVLAAATGVLSFSDRQLLALISATGLLVAAALNFWIGVCQMSAAEWRWVEFDWLVLPDILFTTGVTLRYLSRSPKAVSRIR
jgi:hypothetical protein